MEPIEPPLTAPGWAAARPVRRRPRARRAAALLVAAAVLGTGCLSAPAAYAAAAGARPGWHTARASAGHRRAPRHAVPRHRVHPDPAGRCPTDLGRIACVDLTRQLMWVQDGGRVVFGPVRVRTGRARFTTRTGLFYVYLRDEDHWSGRYHVAMPYSQFFSGGEAFHGLAGESMAAPPGSHGCVNMTVRDARALWRILGIDEPVEVFGRKPGT